MAHSHHENNIARSLWSSAWWPFTGARPSWVGHVQGMVAPGASSFFRTWIHGFGPDPIGIHWLKWGVWMLKLDEKSGRFCGDFKDWRLVFQEFIVSFRGVFSGECLKGIRWDQPHPQPLWRLEDRLIFSDKKGHICPLWKRDGSDSGGCFFQRSNPGGLRTWWNVGGHGLQLVWTHVRGLRIEVSRVFFECWKCVVFLQYLVWAAESTKKEARW